MEQEVVVPFKKEDPEQKDLRVLLLKILDRINMLEKQFEEHAEYVEKQLDRLVDDSFMLR